MSATHGGIIAGMSAHCARIKKEAEDLRNRCDTVKTSGTLVSAELVALVSSIEGAVHRITQDAMTAHLMSDKMDQIVNGKPSFKSPPALSTSKIQEQPKQKTDIDLFG